MTDGTRPEVVPYQRAVASGHWLRRRTQTVVNYVEDRYLRDDIACGSQLCRACDNSATGTPLAGDASHYLVPDAKAIAEYLDFLESPEASVCWPAWFDWYRLEAHSSSISNELSSLSAVSTDFTASTSLAVPRLIL